jgi:flagella basal body P-ring formation protein FlgA
MRFLLLLLASLLPAIALAQQDPAPVRKAIDDWLKVQTQGLPGQVSVEIGGLDAGNQLAPCGAFDISRPSGARTWGRTTVLVRCLDQAGWRIYVPVHVRVRTGYLVAARPLAQGQAVAASDLATQTGDLSDLPANILTESAQAIGKVAGAAIPAGRPLRADMLRAMTVVRQGQTVRVVSRGQGFAVANEGRALGNAVVGQVAQVRLGNGQVVSGIAQADGTIEVSY